MDFVDPLLVLLVSYTQVSDMSKTFNCLKMNTQKNQHSRQLRQMQMNTFVVGKLKFILNVCLFVTGHVRV